jgi:hypothetical protein
MKDSFVSVRLERLECLLVKNTNKGVGKGGLPDEPLYLVYTDEPRRFNPSIFPTSLVFSDFTLLNEVMGFSVKYVDFGVKSSILPDQIDCFKPISQAPIR